MSDAAKNTLLTITELSQRSRLSVTQIRRLVKAGRIPHLQPAGRGGKLLFSHDAVLGSLQDCPGQPSVPPANPQSGPRPKWQK